MRLFNRKTFPEFIPEEKLSKLNGLQYSFREGFSDRLSARFENMQEKDPAFNFMVSLSSLLPRLLIISSIVIFIFTLAMVFMHGEINMEAFIGTQGVDENNFLGYLILE